MKRRLIALAYLLSRPVLDTAFSVNILSYSGGGQNLNVCINYIGASIKELKTSRGPAPETLFITCAHKTKPGTLL
jgi:hypothetical protein